MAKVYIAQEEFESQEELNMFRDFQNAARWYLGPAGDVDGEKTREFLINFVCAQDSFPIFLIIEPFGDVSSELVKLLEDNGISYSIQMEGLKNKNFPILKVVLKDAHSLKRVIDKTFWSAFANNFYALCFSDNCTYKVATRKTIWGQEKPFVHPFFEMKETATVISS